jgi:4-hydroxybenzoate polyprenyltransferase
MGVMEFLSTHEISVPFGQMVSYMFFSTLSFYFKRYKMGLMISFAYTFNWGFLHNSAIFADEMGRPTLGLFVYLASGLMMAVLVVVSFFREKELS